MGLLTTSITIRDRVFPLPLSRRQAEWDRRRYEFTVSPTAMRDVTVEGLRCRVVDKGVGKPVVALHGLGGMAREIAAPLLPLADRYRLVVPDRPGYGGSDQMPRNPVLPQDQAQWLHGLLRRLGVCRPVIVAQSIGAATALAYASRHPDEVAGIVLVAPFCRPTRPAFMPVLRLAALPVVGRLMSRFLYPWLADWILPRRLGRAIMSGPVPRYLKSLPFRAFVTGQALRAMTAELNGFNAGMIAQRVPLHHLQVPTIVLAGCADEIAPVERHARWIARLLPNAELREIKGAGHMLHHAAPDAVVKAVADLGQ